jgi:glutathione-independent formaldehyde dehydrogenase
MMAILHDRIRIARAVNVEVIPLDQAPEAYRAFDAGVPKKFVIDPHHMVNGTAPVFSGSAAAAHR